MKKKKKEDEMRREFGVVNFTIQTIWKTTTQLLVIFDVLLTVHLSIFISVFNQIDAQNLFHNKFLFHASTCFEHMCSKHVEA